MRVVILAPNYFQLQLISYFSRICLPLTIPCLWDIRYFPFPVSITFPFPRFFIAVVVLRQTITTTSLLLPLNPPIPPQFSDNNVCKAVDRLSNKRAHKKFNYAPNFDEKVRNFPRYGRSFARFFMPSVPLQPPLLRSLFSRRNVSLEHEL